MVIDIKVVVCPINFAGFQILRVSASLCKSVSHNLSELMTQTSSSLCH